MKKLIYYMLIAAIILIIIPYSLIHVKADEDLLSVDLHQQHHISNKQLSEQLVGQVNNSLTEEEIISITQAFIDHLVQETGDNYRVKNYQSIEEFKDSFKHLASRNVVDKFVNYYYEEKGQALYIIPTETPPWFESNNEYELTSLTEDTYRVEQTNETKLYGKYTVIIDIKLNENGEPYIINVQYQ